jgi:hypothetical protein
MLLWQIRKQACIMYTQRSKIEGLAEMVPQMEKELRAAEDREKALVIECGTHKGAGGAQNARCRGVRKGQELSFNYMRGFVTREIACSRCMRTPE